MVKTWDLVWPFTTLPKLKVAGETLKPACAPVPDKLIVSGDPGASLVTLIVPVALPAAVGANLTLSVTVCEAFKVAGVVTPVTLYPVPVATTLEMCTAALPEFVSVMFCEVLLPVATLPKFRLVGLALNWPDAAAVPVPVRAIVNGDPVALLVTVMDPVALPAAVGANFALSVALCDGLIVAGVVSPLTVKPVPAATMLEICTAAVPVLESVMLCEVLLPVATLPKFRLVGLALNWPDAAAVPVPVRAIVNGDPVALLVTVMDPVALPAAVGANFALSVALCDGLIVAGVVSPLTVKPVPAATMLEICTAAVPVLESVMLCEVLLPAATLPKLTLLGVAVSLPSAAVVPVPVSATVAVGVVGSLLVMVMLPLAAPEVVGEKVRLTGTDCPAAMVRGVVIPVSPNSAPFKVTTETTKSAAPLLPMVKVDVPFEPIDTVPKPTDAGVKVKFACELVVTVPVKLITLGEVPESPWIVSVPVAVPAVVPFNQTEKLLLCPGATLIGNVIPDTPNSGLEEVACIMFTAT